MYLKKISYNNFRGLKNRSINFDPFVNFIYGKNAQGKTSFIEAIYFVTSGKSFRTKKVKEMIQWNQKDSVVFGLSSTKDTVAISFNNDKRSFYYNKNRVKQVEYIGNIPSISFIPEDIDIIIGNPSVRRGFFDYEISQSSKNYLLSYIRFEKILKLRNNLLKSNNIDEAMFEIYTDKFVEESIKLFLARREYISDISVIVKEKYTKLFDKNAELEIIYDSFITEKEYLNTLEQGISLEEYFKNKIKQKRKNEEIMKFTLIGPHRDEYIFLLNKKDAKAFSSQGEKKSIIFALKIAEIEILKRENNHNPIFIMDDITSYFDNNRKYQIIRYFKENNIQCFITATEEIGIEGKKFYVKGGEIYE